MPVRDNMLLLLSKFSFQTVTLERPLVSKSLIARATRKPTLSLSLANMVHNRIETADECLIANVDAVNEAFVGGLDETVGNADEREGKGRFPCSSSD